MKSKQLRGSNAGGKGVRVYYQVTKEKILNTAFCQIKSLNALKIRKLLWKCQTVYFKLNLLEKN